MIPSEPLSPAAPPEPWRSKRGRRKSAALMEAEADAEHERGKRRRRAAGTARRRRAAMVEAPEVERDVGVAAKDKLEGVAAAGAPAVMKVYSADRRTAFGNDDVCVDEPDAEDMSPAAAAEPWRSTRRRRKSAALMVAEADAEHERRKRRLRAAGKAGTARRRAANVEAPEVERDAGVAAKDKLEAVAAGAPGMEVDSAARRTAFGDEPDGKDMSPAAAAEPWRSTRRRRKSTALMEAEADAEHERRKRRRGAAGNVCTARRRAAKDDKPKQAEAPGVRKRVARPRAKEDHFVGDGVSSEDHFVGEPVPDDEARRRWPARYRAKDPDSNTKRSDFQGGITAICHYRTACVDGAHYDLGDDVCLKTAPGEKNYMGRITELFEGMDHGSYFTCRWFFRVADTVISPKLLKVRDHTHDHRRVFLSEEKDDNMIESIISKVNISYVAPNMTPKEKSQLIAKSDFYYDMSYSVACSTFANMPADNSIATGSEATSEISCEDTDPSKETPTVYFAASPDAQMKTATLLDLYAGCGAMSTGLCLGAALSGIKLNTQWAVDLNTHACSSLKHNHPFTQVRNEKAEDFLSLIKQWDALCKKYDVQNSNSLGSDLPRTLDDEADDENEPLPNGTFEVEKLVDVCYGDPNTTGKVGLWFKVRWKTYDPSQDTWEPIEGLSDSSKCIKEFVESGYRESILPLPGCVDVICGGPPCQGISGLNRFRKPEDPLNDERNKQLVVFMDIVNFLRPKYILMENVVDILKFANGFLGRYALSRLVSMSYQARLGMMVAGCYGLPQFRMRVFLWGALPSVVLPKFPLPTNDVINRGLVPKEFSRCLVAYTETEDKHLEKALVLRDAISDLPEVGNHQPNDVMEYNNTPQTEFQQYIRLSPKEMQDYSFGDAATPKEIQLYDHQPLQLNDDDYERVQQIPVKKGANFRDLKGVQVGTKNTAEFVPVIPRVVLASGKPLVPNYAMSYMKGKSPKPFGRLWWDETVPTVVTRAEPHNQIILHPTQHRVLTVRENARLQGFPDYYRLFGPIKQKYIQVGNAVAVPVARALGYSYGQAYQSEFQGDQPLFKLPRNFIPVDQSTVKRAASVGTSGGEVVQTIECFD